MYQGITTIELDNLTAETAAYLTTTHPDYAILAARIAVSNLHKETDEDFSTVVEKLYNYIHPIQNCQVPLVSKDLYEVTMANAERVNKAIDYERDYDYNFFGFKTLEKSYLMRCDSEPFFIVPLFHILIVIITHTYFQARSSNDHNICLCASR
jgi:ribonucleoside-diphosphate reductase subunit M1